MFKKKRKKNDITFLEDLKTSLLKKDKFGRNEAEVMRGEPISAERRRRHYEHNKRLEMYRIYQERIVPRIKEQGLPYVVLSPYPQLGIGGHDLKYLEPVLKSLGYEIDSDTRFLLTIK